MKWIGGPLDGCVETKGPWPILWYGPDPTEPLRKVIVYKLLSNETYQYDQSLTDSANRYLQEWECEECHVEWLFHWDQCQRCGNRTRVLKAA